MRIDQCGQLEHHLLSRARRHVCPDAGVEGVSGSGHSGVDTARADIGQRRDPLAIDRAHTVECTFRGSIVEPPADERAGLQVEPAGPDVPVDGGIGRGHE